jgi:type II secretion system protein N
MEETLEESSEFSSQPKGRRRSKALFALGYSLLFLISFLVFLLFTFPFGVLKEAAISEVSQATGLTIRIKEVSPSFLIGIDASQIRVASSDGKVQAELESVDFTLSLWKLLLGQAAVHAELVSKNRGTLDLEVSWSLWQLLFDQNFVPAHFDLEAEKFELGGLISLGLNHASHTANDMVKDLLTQISVQANLTGKSEVKLAVDDPLQSTGQIELKLEKATFDLLNPTLVIARQTFKRALVKANLKGGKLSLDSKSGFETQEMKVDLVGSTVLRNPIGNSAMDLGINLKLDGSLKENFGVILSVVGGSEGLLNYKITGTFERPNFANN